MIEDGGNRFYVRRKSGGPATVVQTCENFGKTGFIQFIYVNGYVYYGVPLWENGKHRIEFWRFNPKQPTAEKLWELPNRDSFAVDADGNILAIPKSSTN